MKIISGAECEITEVSQREVSSLNNNLPQGTNVAVKKPGEVRQQFNGVRKFSLPPDSQQIILEAGLLDSCSCPVGTEIEILK